MPNGQLKQIKKFETKELEFEVFTPESDGYGRYSHVTIIVHSKDKFNKKITEFSKEEIDELVKGLEHLGKWEQYKNLKKELDKEENEY